MSLIWWIRRDLRVTDNRALSQLVAHNELLPLFILDPALLNSSYAAQRRIDFLFANLAELKSELQRLGSDLIIRTGHPKAVFSQLKEEIKIDLIVAQNDLTPYAIKRDQQIAAHFPLQLIEGITILPSDLILKKDQTPYTVFTPYKNRWLAYLSASSIQLEKKVTQLPPIPDIHSDPFPAYKIDPEFPPGETAAQKRMAHFLKTALANYETDRNFPAVDGTAKLSPYLRFGVLSPRFLFVQLHSYMTATESKSGAAVWRNELIWREFYYMILTHFPHVMNQNFRAKYDRLIWRNNVAEFEAWKKGETGYPLVDAGMRQLATTGWMHNRVRMIVASFLIKDLLIDWRWGEKWFMQQLLDGDPAANNGGWQWSAGTGTDAAPYFRIFNPITQSKKFDPKGTYIRRWVPELTDLPNKFIHAPWLLPDSVQNQLKFQINDQYPAPIVDHSFARKRTLAAYKQIQELKDK